MTALKPSYPLYLANEAQSPNRDLAVTDKYSGQIATYVAQADAATINEGIAWAVKAAEPMAQMAAYERQAVLNHCVTRFQERYDELVHAEKIIEQNIAEFIPLLKQRRIEVAMREVPEKIKEIRNTALNSVFADEVQNMDKQSREVLEKVIAYMEKKYISVPMIMAKEILINS